MQSTKNRLQIRQTVMRIALAKLIYFEIMIPL